MLRKHRPHSIQTLSSLMGRTRFAQEVASTLECFQGVSFSQNQEYPDWQPLSDDSMKHLPALDGFDGPSREKWFHKQPLSLSQSEVTKTYDCTEGCLGSKLGCTGPCHFFYSFTNKMQNFLRAESETIRKHLFYTILRHVSCEFPLPLLVTWLGRCL